MTRLNALICLVLGCVTLLIYAPAKNFEFLTYDDFAYVNPQPVQQGLSWSSARWALTARQAANWHPLTTLSHILDVTLYGTGPAGPHFTNALLHSINALLAFVVLLTMTGQAWPSAIVAALFAWHPLRVESVAWVSERKDLLSGLFFLLTLLAYRRYARRLKSVDYVWVVIAFALGLLSKPMLVTVPFLLLLLDLWPLKRNVSWQRLVLEKIPLLAMALAASVATLLIQKHAGAVRDAERYPLTIRIGNAVWAYGRYLFKTVYPLKLAPFYPYFGVLPGTTLPTPLVLASAICAFAITLLTIAMFKHHRAPIVGWLWFLGMLVPVIGIVQVGFASMADRYTYLPHIGLFIAVVFGTAALARRLKIPQIAIGLGTALVLLLLIVRTSIQLQYWHDTISLFTHALAVTEKNHVAHSNIAYALIDQGRGPEAIEHFKAVIEIKPAEAGSYYNIGYILESMHRLDEAKAWYRKAIELDPKSADAHINLGSILLGEGDAAGALREFSAAADAAPESFAAHYNRGVALQDTGNKDAAATELAIARQIASPQQLADFFGNSTTRPVLQAAQIRDTR